MIGLQFTRTTDYEGITEGQLEWLLTNDTQTINNSQLEISVDYRQYFIRNRVKKRNTTKFRLN